MTLFMAGAWCVMTLAWGYFAWHVWSRRRWRAGVFGYFLLAVAAYHVVLATMSVRLAVRVVGCP